MKQKNHYAAPVIEVLSVRTEQGFAVSLTTEDYDETVGSWSRIEGWN